MASKRISTFDYLRKTHEGRVYWFNTLRFSKADLVKLPFFDSSKLGRRATNMLLLGLSLPAILDPNSGSATEYLRAFSTLLSEFDAYQALHPPDGSTPSSSSRARIPQMFKRGVHSTKAGPRRISGADSTNSPSNANESGEARSISGSHGPSSFGGLTGMTDRDLLPGEEYSFLLTPSLPFDPDYFETFATLCDVLMDCYSKILSLLNSPDACVPGIGDLFQKVDAKVKKTLVVPMVREFEDASKQGVKSEISGLGKVVLGGLM